MGRTRLQKLSRKNPFRLGPSWYFRFREDVTLIDGRVKRLNRKVRLGEASGPDAMTRKQAEQVAREEYLDKVNAANRAPGSMATVSEFIAMRFQKDIARDSPHYRSVLPHVERGIGELQLRQVRPSHVLDLMARLRAQGLSGAWQKHVFGAVRRIFRHAKAVGAYSGDVPTEYLPAPKVDSKPRGALSVEQVRGVLEILEPPYRQFALLLTLTGLRAGEALGLKWPAVNTTDKPRVVDGVYLPPRSFALVGQWTRGAWVDRLKSRGRAPEVLPLPTMAAEAIEEWRAATKATSEWVFDLGRGTGKPLEPSTACNDKLKPAFREVMGLHRAAEVEQSWHWLRHTLATMADEAGMTEAQRQRILRHGSAAMTRRYTHPEFAALTDGLNRVGRMLSGEEPVAKVVEIRRA